jgi:hypothetical protein
LGIRPITKADLPKVEELIYYCFSLGQEPRSKEKRTDYYNSCDFNLSYGYFVKDELVSTWFVFPWQIFIRGKTFPLGAIADVTTQPNFRRRGYIRELFEHSLTQMKNEQISISGLYPFKYSYYEKFGYALCAEEKMIKSDPRNLLLPEKYTLLTIKKIPKERSFVTIKELRDLVGKKHSFMKLPDQLTWKIRRLRKRDEVYGVYNKNELEGYFIARITKLPEGEWSSTLDFNEVVFATQNAFVTILQYIKQHTDQTGEFWYPLIQNELGFSSFERKFDITIRHRPAIMLRIIDAEQVLKQLPYPSDIDFSFTLKLHDQWAAWNNATFKVIIQKGKAEIKQVETNDCDIALDINAFTQLVVGYKTLKELTSWSNVKTSSEKEEQISALFPKWPMATLTYV